MKVTILTQDDGPESREALDLGNRLQAEDYPVITLDWEDEEARSLADLYDIYSAPAVLVTTDNGVYLELWQGDVPTMSDVKYRAGNA